MRHRRFYRRFLAVLVLLLILCAAAWTGAWYLLAGRVSAAVLAWEQQRRAEGWTITQGAPRRSGWPMAAGVTLPDIRVAGGGQYWPGGFVWGAQSLRLAVDVRHLGDLYWGVTGRQTLTLGKTSAIPFQAARFAGQIVLSPGGGPRLFQLHAETLIAALPGADGRPEALSLASLDGAATADAMAGATGDALVVAASMTGLGLPPHLLPGLGDRLQSLGFDLALSGPVPVPVPGPPAAGAPAPALAWRNAGGSLALRAFHLTDGPLAVEGTGRLQLDAFLRPEGTLALRLAGLDETVARLAEKGALTRAEATAIRALLGLMMRPAGSDVLLAPVSLHGGLVSLGAIPLLRLPL